MSEADTRDGDDKPAFGDDVAEHLYDDGFEDLAQLVDGPARINQFEAEDFLEPLGDGWILRAYNDREEIQYARATDETLIQIRDAGHDGEFGRPFEAWVGEFGDYVLSGRYALEYIYPADSGFEVADSDD